MPAEESSGRNGMFSPERVTFYGRSLSEYRLMFLLDDLNIRNERILDCPGGPASFAAEGARNGYTAIAIDPMYSRPPEELERIGRQDIEYIVEKIDASRQERNWNYYASPDDLRHRQHQILDKFLQDFGERPPGSPASPYVIGELPALPFRDQEFDVALSSHFLFSFFQLTGLEFTIRSIIEMARVARQVRVTPLKSNEQDRHARFKHLGMVLKKLETAGLQVDIVKNNFEFQHGTNDLMIVQRRR